MSKASAVGRITVTSNGTSIFSILQATTGDLYQNFSGEASAPETITPDWEATGATKPVVTFQAFSAGSDAGATIDLSTATATWYVDDSLLTFNSAGVSTNVLGGETGHFTKGTSTDMQPTLTINKNLVKVNTGASFNIKCIVDCTVGNTNTKLTSLIPVTIVKGTENARNVHIICADTKNVFTITEKGGTCKVKAQVIQGDATKTSGFTYKWYLQDPAASETWNLQTETSNTYEVKEEDVNSCALVKVEVYNGSTLYGSDVQSITDISDEYIVYANPTNNSNPTAENFVEGVGGTITYAPFVRKRGDSNNVSATFAMNVYTTVGVDITASAVTEQTTGTFVVSGDVVISYKGAEYVITATI